MTQKIRKKKRKKKGTLGGELFAVAGVDVGEEGGDLGVGDGHGEDGRLLNEGLIRGPVLHLLDPISKK